MSKTKNKPFLKKNSGMTITRKITILYGGIFSLSLIIISLFILLNASLIQQNFTKQELLQTINNIEKHINENKVLSDTVLRTLLENKYVEVNIIELNDHEIYKSSIGEMPEFIDSPRPTAPNIKDNQKTEEGLRIKALIDKGYKVYEKRGNQVNSKEYIIDSGPNDETMLIEKRFASGDNQYLIQCFKQVTKDYFYVQSFGLRMLLIDIIGIACAILIGSYISRKILKPVEKIRIAAERISIEDLSQRINTDGPDDEMKELTVTFNSMIARLEDSFNKQNQFISDASHELRTPIAVIQGYANLVNRWGKGDPSVLQEAIDSILGETDHMSSLIKKLLFLAKSDQSMIHLQKQPLCLNEVVGEITRELKIMEIKRNITVEEKGAVNILGDSALIKQLLWIHTENALKYTKEGGNIRFTIGKNKNYGFVSVQDNGAGIAPEAIPFIFDRFYRADKSRNKEIPGTGLGLSIAHWIVNCHGGKITVESNNGTTFTDTFLIYDKK